MSFPLLEVLRIDVCLQNAWLQQWFVGESLVARPFPSIKDLTICGETPTISALLSSFPPTLVSLDLDVNDTLYNILPTVGRLSSLVHLRIFFGGYRKFSRTDFDCISRLSSLQKCHVEWGGPLPFQDGTLSSNDCLWLTDEYFKGWVSNLPQLRDLFLALNSATITQSSLQSLADSCPSLLKCQLMWEHDLNTWTSLGAPLFPSLTFLHLGKVKDHGCRRSHAVINENASRDVKLIRSLAPKLTSFLTNHESVSFDYRSNVWPPYEMALKIAFEAGV